MGGGGWGGCGDEPALSQRSQKLTKRNQHLKKSTRGRDNNNNNKMGSSVFFFGRGGCLVYQKKERREFSEKKNSSFFIFNALFSFPFLFFFSSGRESLPRSFSISISNTHTTYRQQLPFSSESVFWNESAQSCSENGRHVRLM